MRIKELRQEAGLTQAQLAEILHVKQNTISYWEQGKTSPDRDTLVKLADLFHVTLGYLEGLEEDRPNPLTIAVNLRYLMERDQRTSEDVCADLHFSTDDFEQWIQGKEIPDTESFERLQDYFYASPTFLVNEHDYFSDKNKTFHSYTIPELDFMQHRQILLERLENMYKNNPAVFNDGWLKFLQAATKKDITIKSEIYGTAMLIALNHKFITFEQAQAIVPYELVNLVNKNIDKLEDYEKLTWAGATWRHFQAVIEELQITFFPYDKKPD